MCSGAIIVFSVIWRWPNFTPEEVLSPYGLELLQKNIFPLSTQALDKLQQFRTAVGYPLHINHNGLNRRGWRSAWDHMRLMTELGATKRKWSFHCAGVAFDVSCYDLPVEDLHVLALDFGWPGIGRYDWGLHLDNRAGPLARWNNAKTS